jgi:hypothetical protein
VSGYSNEQLLAAIEAALKARDFEAVGDFLRVLAVQSPHDAQAVLDALAIAQAVNR